MSHKNQIDGRLEVHLWFPLTTIQVMIQKMDFVPQQHGNDAGLLLTSSVSPSPTRNAAVRIPFVTMQKKKTKLTNKKYSAIQSVGSSRHSVQRGNEKLRFFWTFR